MPPLKQLPYLFIAVILLGACSMPHDDQRASDIDAFLSDAYQKGLFNGVVLVAEEGEVVYEGAFGMADVTNGIPLTTASPFQVASISKTFTAAAIFILMEEGRLDLDMRVTDFLPSFPYPEVTVRHLISHTAGLYPYNPLFTEYWEDKTRIASNDDVLDMYLQHKPELFFEPGTEQSYCNMCYVVLAEIVETVSGETFPDFLSTRIFDPLEMEQSGVYTKLQGAPPKGLTVEHDISVESGTLVHAASLPENKEMHYLHGKVGDDKVYASARDLLKWDQALYTDRLISSGTLEKAFTSTSAGVEVNHNPFELGMGFQLDSTEAFGKLVYNNGGEPGLKARFRRYIDTHRTIIVLSNANVLYTTGITDAVTNVMYGKDPVMPKRSISELLSEVIVADASTDVVSLADSLSMYPEEFYLSESEIDFLAGRLWSMERFDEGMVLLHYNVDRFPESVGARYTLGEGYMETGRPTEAVKIFNETLEMVDSQDRDRSDFRAYLVSLIEDLESGNDD